MTKVFGEQPLALPGSANNKYYDLFLPYFKPKPDHTNKKREMDLKWPKVYNDNNVSLKYYIAILLLKT